MRDNDSRAVLFRTEGNTEIGLGHAMRSLALAQKCRVRGWDVSLLTSFASSGLKSLAETAGIHVVEREMVAGSISDAQETSDVAAERNASWVAVDAYCFDAQFQRELKTRSTSRLLLWDDFGEAEMYFADIVLNQNLHANRDLYRNRLPRTTLLLGLQYAVLRSQFDAWSGVHHSISGSVTRVLIALGGSDRPNVAMKVLRAVRETPGQAQFVVIAGSANPNLQELQAYVDTLGSRFQLIHHTDDMPKMMASADVAIIAGGSTCWEAAFMGLPAVVITTVEHQKTVAASLQEQKLAVSLGWWEDLRGDDLVEALRLMDQAAFRADMSSRGQRAVDGNGAVRVILEMERE